MATLAVVPDFQPREDGEPGGGARRQDPNRDKFRLEGGEEAFRHGVIETFPGPAHRADDATCGDVADRRILPSP